MLKEMMKSLTVKLEKKKRRQNRNKWKGESLSFCKWGGALHDVLFYSSIIIKPGLSLRTINYLLYKLF